MRLPETQAQRVKPFRKHEAMNRDLPESIVLNSHHPRIPARQEFVAKICRRHGIIGLGHFGVTIPVNTAPALIEKRESFQRQRLKRSSLDRIEFSDLLARGALDAGVCDLGFPVREKSVLHFTACEEPAFDRVVLNIFNAVLDFTFVAQGVRLGGKDHEAIVFRERDYKDWRDREKSRRSGWLVLILSHAGAGHSEQRFPD